jgi:hypothetical protein
MSGTTNRRSIAALKALKVLVRITTDCPTMKHRSFRRQAARIAFAWTACLIVLLANTSSSDARSTACRAFLERAVTLTVRQRVPTEIEGFVETGDTAHFDRDVHMSWSVRRSDGARTREASILPDPHRNGRAFFHPGYIQGTYVVTLNAVSSEGVPCAPATLKIHVDTEYTQYAAIGVFTREGHARIGGRVVSEATQFSLPIYMSAAARDEDIELRAGLKLLDPRIYVGAGYRHLNGVAGNTANGWGYGVERMPDIDRRFSLAGELWYYPSLGNAFTKGAQRVSLQYRVLSYGLSITQLLPRDHYFVQAGIRRDHAIPFSDATGGIDRTTPSLTLGLRL